MSKYELTRGIFLLMAEEIASCANTMYDVAEKMKNPDRDDQALLREKFTMLSGCTGGIITALCMLTGENISGDEVLRHIGSGEPLLKHPPFANILDNLDRRQHHDG